MQRRAAERNQMLRDEWILKLAGWDASQLLFLDESAANERTMDRKYGWAPIGVSHMNISLLNVQKGGQSFRFTLSMVFMFGISFRDHTQRNCLMNSYVHRCCHAAHLIQVQGLF